MVRGEKASCRSNFKKRVKSKDKVSDDSDEDYVVSEEEDQVSDDDSKDYYSSLDECASEESLGVFVEAMDVEEKEVKKVVRSKAKRGYLEESLGDFIEEEDEEEEKEVKKFVRSKAKKGSSAKGKIGDDTSRKRKRASYGDEEDEDYEEEADEEDDDEEFTLDEDDCLEEDEELTTPRKKNNTKMCKRVLQKKPKPRGRKSRKSAAPKRSLRKRGKKKRGLKRKKRVDEDDDDYVDFDDDFMDKRPSVNKKSKANVGRRRRYKVLSDSDLVSSGSSGHVYTISEEEREQIREAGRLCGNLNSSLRSSLSSKRTQEDEDLGEHKKPPGRKGKEKVEEVKTEVVKQVCGICLSEEDKRRLRGTLNCCSHYFCFTCIMEWSKVESRCPLCKQRFQTISKPARSAAGVDLREAVIQVPERDQVYQPSEEELRSYLDPYENVICSECHQGGDDGLMLLCDLCDSSAHTYCVGLGREVPEGNWYCDGCRPVALGSSSSQTQDSLPDQRTISNNLYNRPSPINLGESLDPTLASSPRTPFTQRFGNLSSPRFPVGDGTASSPVSGAGAPTLSGRRWIHRQIQNLLSINRINYMAGRTDGMSTANLSNDFLNSQIDLRRETTVQQPRLQENRTLYTIFEENLQDNPSSSLQGRDLFPSRLAHMRRQAVPDSTTATIDRTVNLTLWPELEGMNSLSGTRSNVGTDGCVSPLTVRDEGDLAKEQLQSMVRNHLKNLSSDIDLGHSVFKDIASSSVHTILAACGLEHRRSEVQVVPALSSICSHMERLAAGQTSLMKGCCSTCFDSFVKDVVKRIMDTRQPQWLSLGL